MDAAPLDPRDLPRAAALSALVGWNQTEDDWALFHRRGAIQAVADGRDALAASAAFIRYGQGLAWISMVLVRPDLRRQGLATALMRWALGAVADTGCVALDATPAGRDVYRHLGFTDVFGFRRWALPDALPAEPRLAPRQLRADDWPALLAMDRAAFGAPREAVLRDFARRLPGAAFIVEEPSGITGFVLARDGVRCPQIGPVMARDAQTGRALVAAALGALPPRAGGPRAVLDLIDSREAIATWLTAHGGVEQRPFTRMTRGVSPPGDAAGCIAVAGPEFG